MNMRCCRNRISGRFMNPKPNNILDIDWHIKKALKREVEIELRLHISLPNLHNCQGITTAISLKPLLALNIYETIRR